MTERRRPVHLAALVGASAAVYAASLAGVAALQSSTDRAVIEGQAPAKEAAGRLGESHDRLQADLDAAAQRYADSAARYQTLVDGIAAMETGLADYAGGVSRATGAAGELPATAPLPTVRRTVTTAVAKPHVRATTGASGR